MSIHPAYLIREGWLGLKRARGAVVLSLSTIAISLTLLGVFVLLTVNIQQIVHKFQRQLSVEMFIDNGLDTAQIERLKNALGANPDIETLQYISKDEALARFEQEFGEDLIDLLGENPLPASFQIRLKLKNPTMKQLNSTVKQLERYPGADEVVFQGRLFELIGRYSRFVLIIDIVLILIVLIATVLVVGNTLRLILVSQQETIEIMKLVGATPLFIRMPYIIQGLIQGVVGGIISSVFLLVCAQIIQYQFPQLLKIILPVLFFPIALGLLLGIVGSILGLRRFFRA